MVLIGARLLYAAALSLLGAHSGLVGLHTTLLFGPPIFLP